MSLAAHIAAQRDRYGIPHAVACRALGISQAWLYKWRRGDTSPRRARRAALAAMIASVFHAHKGTYGSPRICDELMAMGWRVGVNTVAKLMAEQGLVARPKRRRRALTKPDAAARKAPDALKRDFTPPDAPDVAWVGDVTELPNAEGKFYLASVLDLHSRRCVGFAMGQRHDAELAKAALCVAIAVRGGTVTGVIMHTDQGGEYTGQVFKRACERAGITPSMGRTGSALDNAVAEAFNSTLEFELLSRCAFPSRQQARRAVAAWIDEYNTVRRHSTAGNMCPVDYELARATGDESACDLAPAAADGPVPDPHEAPAGPSNGHHKQKGGGYAAAHYRDGRRPGSAAHGTGPPLRPQGSLRDLLRRRPAAGPDPGASTAPDGQAVRAGRVLPETARGAMGEQVETEQNTCSKIKNQKIIYQEVSTVTGD